MATSGSRAATTTSSARPAIASAQARSRNAWRSIPPWRSPASIGSPDPIRGEVVAAFIVPAAGYEPSAALAAEIQMFVKERLAAHEYPRKVRFLSTMPMTVTGKIRRKDLRELDRQQDGEPA